MPFNDASWDRFVTSIRSIYTELKQQPVSGQVASYIPQLKEKDPELFSVSVVSTDGRSFHIGDTDARFTIQSVSKPTTYALALTEHGDAYVERHVSREPSGSSFNSYTFLPDHRPHNALINSGAIMCASMVQAGRPKYKRFEHVMDLWESTCGKDNIGFCNSTYLSESSEPYRNLALASMMKNEGVFPEGTDIHDTLELYFQICSITANTEGLARMGACFANVGVLPRTTTVVFEPEVVRDVLTVMLTSGMYDYSGTWTYIVGCPSKSGVSGALMLVIPNLCSIAIFSPPLDAYGNSVRGVAVATAVSRLYTINLIESSLSVVGACKQKRSFDTAATSVDFINAMRLHVTLRVFMAYVDEGTDINAPDYDGRTALHVTMEDGNHDSAQLLLLYGARRFTPDRWGTTPVHALDRGDERLVAMYCHTVRVRQMLVRYVRQYRRQAGSR